jgi:SiaC family regulatory phosphoprotein
MSTETRADLFVPATGSSPEVDFRFSEHALSLRGESYPENAAAFYADIIAATRAYLADAAHGHAVTVNVALTYFNSSSTKMLFTLFAALSDAAEAGTRIVLNWHHDVDDDTILEFGAELHDEFPAIDFHDVPVEG